MAQIIPANRLRKSPFYQSTLNEGAQSFLVYNQMLIPRGYGDLEAEYWRLINGVSMWDVAAQRQVQLKGPDAARLAQLLCARDLSNISIGQGKYVAICNHQGVMLNDPIAMKVDEDCFWLSISNTDIWMWAACVAGERGLDAKVSEPDASPLAVQGPKAVDVVASLAGDWVRDLRYFWFKDATIAGIPLKIARSGWSKQGGFELYLLDSARGDELWDIVKEAGRPWDIGPGYPNPSERTESGLLNFDVDADAATNPFEVRMERFVDVDISDEVIGVPALRRIKAEGAKRRQFGIVLASAQEAENQAINDPIRRDGIEIGRMTHKVWSYRLERMIGYALASAHARPGDAVEVMRADGSSVAGTLADLPFDPTTSRA